MPPPKEIPGFYFDSEKNRFFPIMGPVPGWRRRAPPPTRPPIVIAGESSASEKDCDAQKTRKRRRVSNLLELRELGGRLLISREGAYDFKQEFRKLQASYPMAWKYQDTSDVADTALVQFRGIIQMPEGLKETTLLSTGSIAGTLGLYDVGLASQRFNHGNECIPQPVLPLLAKCTGDRRSPVGTIWTSAEASSSFSSSISSIRKISRPSRNAADGGLSSPRILVTTLGSGDCGGCSYIVNLGGPLDFTSPSVLGKTSRIGLLNGTIWSMDCNPNGTNAVLGSNRGSVLIDVETGSQSWVFCSRSDVFAQQFDQYGDTFLCGLRNGSIVQVDVHQRQTGHAPITYTPSREQIVLNKKSRASAVCSLVALQSDDQYFLSSSMDGSIKLYDRRFGRGGVVQSYKGHANSHTRIQLGVDPSETFLMSGGEDCYTRIWSIKSGELIFQERLSDSVVTSVCWPRNSHASYGICGSAEPSSECYGDGSLQLMHSWGAWLGSREGLFYIHGT